ncbi:MAG: polysaccharide biosynthesis protein [Clostridia bacterium]|nr:polysaccharide biosynthesis protein [Clostridia bacterium]
MGGALLLTVGAVLAKVFSAVYRIILTRILGGVGIGLYQLVFPVYSMCLVLSTTGIPIAVSKVIAKSEDVKFSIKYCFKFTIIISIILACVLFAFSDILAKSQGDIRIAICFKLLAPSIVIVGVSSVLKGYFQGMMNYIPSAVSQVVEQFVKLVVGLLLSVFLIDWGLIYSIVGAIIGIVVSEIVTMLILLMNFKKKGIKTSAKNTYTNKKQILKDILPITLTNLILPISTFIDSILVIKLLNINFSSEISIYLYGLESGAVNNIVTLPTIFSFAVATAVMPSFSKENQDRTKFSKIFQLVILITIPCFAIFVVAPEGILRILYSNTISSQGIDGLSISAELLRIGGFGMIFLALNQIISSYLQANDKRLSTIKNLIIGVMCKFLIEIIYLPYIDINIYALAIASTLCYLIVFVLNFLQVRKIQKISFEKFFGMKIVVSSILMLLVYFVINSIGKSLFVSFFAYFIAGCSYFFSVYLLDIFPYKKSIFHQKS